MTVYNVSVVFSLLVRFDVVTHEPLYNRNLKARNLDHDTHSKNCWVSRPNILYISNSKTNILCPCFVCTKKKNLGS